MHRVAREAVDSFSRFSLTEALGTKHALVLVGRQARAAVVPEAAGERHIANTRVACDRPVKLRQVLTRIVRIAAGQNALDSIKRLWYPLTMAVPANHHGTLGSELEWVDDLFLFFLPKAPRRSR